MVEAWITVLQLQAKDFLHFNTDQRHLMYPNDQRLGRGKKEFSPNDFII